MYVGIHANYGYHADFVICSSQSYFLSGDFSLWLINSSEGDTPVVKCAAGIYTNSKRKRLCSILT